MSANAEVFASLLQKPDLPDHERAAFLGALLRLAEDDAQGATYRPRVELALTRLEEARTAERSLRVTEILLHESRSSALRLIREVCAIVLERAADADP